MAGRRLEAVDCELAAAEDWRLPGRVVERVEARGKNLLIHCAALEGAGVEQPGGLPVAIWTHMGMTGSWHSYRLGEPWQLPRERARIVLHTQRRVLPCFSPEALEFLGPRGLARHRVLATLGPDLLDPDADLDGPSPGSALWARSRSATRSCVSRRSPGSATSTSRSLLFLARPRSLFASESVP
ncbi:DNA-formamidopyrimidine glycosylase family protein [Pseudenhygromyxa sp. WMMC2535]|uniref:DNA-formamidopyrimidine glycosylase family protein n=1 Tax=Pseudenhygromyxa sp. WMMC2535 TaxID=2712867 RepID=UPI0031F8E0FF